MSNEDEEEDGDRREGDEVQFEGDDENGDDGDEGVKEGVLMSLVETIRRT